MVREQVNSKMAEIEPFLVELGKLCSDTALVVRGEIELSVGAHYLRERIVQGILSCCGSEQDHVIPFTSEPCLFDADTRILKGID